ncbi:MAG: hypothetical protein BWZ10_02671 [candidate division BRC1 bacterium ADurb.BinA364]|nr:MAG: hypothetical protein BWZ10_02671 [candidate division BRC1 bacterium ADurb.BinA364]
MGVERRDIHRSFERTVLPQAFDQAGVLRLGSEAGDVESPGRAAIGPHLSDSARIAGLGPIVVGDQPAQRFVLRRVEAFIQMLRPPHHMHRGDSVFAQVFQLPIGFVHARIERSVFADEHAVVPGRVGALADIVRLLVVRSVSRKAESRAGCQQPVDRRNAVFSLGYADDRTEHIGVGNLVALDQFRRKSRHQRFAIRDADAAMHYGPVVFDPFAKERIVLMAAVPFAPEKAARRIEEAFIERRAEPRGDRFDIAMKRGEIAIKAFDVLRIVVAGRLRPGDDLVFVIGLHRDGHFGIGAKERGQAAVEFALAIGVELFQRFLLEVVAAVVEQALAEIASALRLVLAVEQKVQGKPCGRIGLLDDFGHRLRRPAMREHRRPNRWDAFVVLFQRLAVWAAGLAPVRPRRPFLVGFVFDVAAGDKRAPGHRASQEVVVPVADIAPVVDRRPGGDAASVRLLLVEP